VGLSLRIEEFTEQHSKEICDWKYDGEYSIYNLPAWDKVCNDNWAITVEEKRKKEFYAIVDDYNNLCAYLRLQNKIQYVVFGIGLKPSLCGQGLGNTLMEIAKQQCATQYPNRRIALEVRSFNKRAIECYKKAAFTVKEIYKKETPLGSDEFVRMKYSY
jgi:ribosomal protein S18 acetylase RimI-like enzyme